MKAKAEGGFCMLDLVTGALVAAIVGACALPNMNALMESYQLRSTASRIGFEIARARMQAATEGRLVCLHVASGRLERRVGTTAEPDCAQNQPLEVSTLPQRVHTSDTEIRFDGRGVAIERAPISVQTGAGELLVETDVLGRVTIS